MAAVTGSAQPNVTPLIDVLLTLLVIFMVIAPIAPKGEDALLPQPPTSTSTPPPEGTVVLQIVQNAGGETELRINRQAVPWSNLQQRLTEIFKFRATRVLFVQAEGALDWMEVAQAIGIAHAAGVDKVGLITARIQSGG